MKKRRTSSAAKTRPDRRKGASARRRAGTARARRSRGSDEEALRRTILSRTSGAGAARWNPGPDEVQQSVAKLVLTLAEFLRQVLERQAIRRMDEGTLTKREIEDIGLALMRLEQALRDVAGRFDLTLEDLNLDLGPGGRLM